MDLSGQLTFEVLDGSVFFLNRILGLVKPSLQTSNVCLETFNDLVGFLDLTRRVSSCLLQLCYLLCRDIYSGLEIVYFEFLTLKRFFFLLQCTFQIADFDPKTFFRVLAGNVLVIKGVFSLSNPCL